MTKKQLKKEKLELLDKVEEFLLVPKHKVKDWRNLAEYPNGVSTDVFDEGACRFCIYGAVNMLAGHIACVEEPAFSLKRTLSRLGEHKDKLNHSFAKRWTTKQLKELFEMTRQYIVLDKKDEV